MGGCHEVAPVLTHDPRSPLDLIPDGLLVAPGKQLLLVNPPKKLIRPPYLSISSRGSLPGTLGWTGLKISMPISIKSSISGATAPSECMMIITSGFFAFCVLVAWRITAKTGYSGALGLLYFVPIANFVFLLVLAFSEWPVHRELKSLKDILVRQPGAAPPPMANQ